MKIFIICSKNFYDKIPEIQKLLEGMGHIITLPNHFDDPATESRYLDLGNEAHSRWKAEKLRHSAKVIGRQDAVLVLNYEKNGIRNYIGGATFIEMYDAFRLGKKIFMMNEIPDGILKDEINGFNSIIINSDLAKVV